MAESKAPSDMQAAAEISRTMESLRLRAVTAEEAWEKLQTSAEAHRELRAAVDEFCRNYCDLELVMKSKCSSFCPIGKLKRGGEEDG